MNMLKSLRTTSRKPMRVMHGLWMKWLRQEKQQESQIGKTNHDKGYKDLIWFNTVNGIGMITNKT